MKYKLSVLLPAIRQERWVGVYDSINKAFNDTLELIIISSKPLPGELLNKKNVKYIFSERSPAQKQQEGLCQAEGEWVTWMSDDSTWVPGALDKVFESIPDVKDLGTFYVMKYLEGPEFEFPKEHQDAWGYKTNYDFMKSDAYYKCHTHNSSDFPFVPEDAPILSICLIKRLLLWKIGGYDCRFQTQAMASDDLSIRLMNYGCKYVLLDQVVQQCGWMEQGTGDHGPLHYAQTLHDEPLLKSMYNNDSCKDRTIIPLDNWKDTPAVWKRRKG